MTTLDEIRIALELASFVASIVVALAAVFGLQQLRLVKLDMHIRNDRAAKEAAVDYGNNYLTIFVPLINAWFFQHLKAKLPSYRGPVGDFSKGSLPAAEETAALARYRLFGWMKALNALEAIAAAFMVGVADERTGFAIIGRSFCASVASCYDVICICRDHDACRHWENIVSLHRIWSGRISKAELQANREKLDKRIAEMNTEFVPPIGVDLDL